eukprot:TRINITY_DN31044_c0_g1_i1.p1 TRINITY_DN31044_c0_g1~~TRINITY_DN31044_c0_g1_i1.p1  ORF type:complete len:133 (-),score=1.88 TRINITY_DN31044_c0_g1_i1:67-465(-)
MRAKNMNTKKSHVKGAVNIPLSQFRGRLDEIPKDQPVYVHCRSSQRSYNMVRALGQLGFENIYNIDGSFLGISEYEYFNDVTLNRDPIVTEYNFNQYKQDSNGLLIQQSGSSEEKTISARLIVIIWNKVYYK